ncbi:FecR family protein [Sinomicrobium soli]|uniref:FecR family protein n=1 Tax=Sinomicrobium sp. N-1-3-6 TaxID=2219864 RepID=UPI001374E837|nr:FecR family protein [Sinomicrobium sp. N-1-3-6]
MENLVVKLLTGTISDAEMTELRERLQDPEYRSRLQQYVRDNYDLNMAALETDADDAFEKVMNAIEDKRRPVRILRPSILKYAATVLVLLGAGLLLQNYLGRADREVLVPADESITLELGNGKVQTINPADTIRFTGTAGKIVATQQQGVLEYTTEGQTGDTVYNTLRVPYGKRFRVRLSDGTLVHLNAGTELVYPISFEGKTQRTVRLNGEAFFEVNRDTLHPFVVETGAIDIRVLGTSFNVSVYPEDRETGVVLVEGAVSMNLKNSPDTAAAPVVLAPGHKGTYRHDSDGIAVTEVNTDLYTSWRYGELMFRNMPFDAILKKLERHYNVKIENSNSVLGKELFNAGFKEVPVDSVLTFFNDVHKINYEIRDNQVFIR